MINKDKAISAIRSKRLIYSQLISPSDVKSPSYCTAGALLSASGVSDTQIRRLEKTGKFGIKTIRREYGITQSQLMKIVEINDDAPARLRKRRVIAAIKKL